MAKIKCILLIPLVHGNGSPVEQSELRGILNRLLFEFGGYTVAGEVEGGWRSPDGKEYRDRNTQVWVAVESRRLPALRQTVAEIGRQLGQEAMYLEVSGGHVEIVPVAGRRATRK